MFMLRVFLFVFIYTVLSTSCTRSDVKSPNQISTIQDLLNCPLPSTSSRIIYYGTSGADFTLYAREKQSQSWIDEFFKGDFTSVQAQSGNNFNVVKQLDKNTSFYNLVYAIYGREIPKQFIDI